jgi:hypothetical protein
MKNLKDWAFGIFVLVLGFAFYKGSELYSPGSYPNVEIYGFGANEKDLLKAIQQFKAANPKFIVPEEFNLEGGRGKGPDDHWFTVYFYYSDTREIVYVWTRPKGLNMYTSLALVGINQGSESGNWKDINRDFSSAENSAQIDKFETLILNPIEKIVEAQR